MKKEKIEFTFSEIAHLEAVINILENEATRLEKMSTFEVVERRKRYIEQLKSLYVKLCKTMLPTVIIPSETLPKTF